MAASRWFIEFSGECPTPGQRGTAGGRTAVCCCHLWLNGARLLYNDGARVSELLQVSLTPECLYTMASRRDATAALRDWFPREPTKWQIMLMGPETRRNFEKVAQLLVEHYQLQPGEVLPQVAFTPHSVRNLAGFQGSVPTCFNTTINTYRQPPSPRACAFYVMEWCSKQRKGRPW